MRFGVRSGVGGGQVVLSVLGLARCAAPEALPGEHGADVDVRGGAAGGFDEVRGRRGWVVVVVVVVVIVVIVVIVMMVVMGGARGGGGPRGRIGDWDGDVVGERALIVYGGGEVIGEADAVVDDEADVVRAR